MDASTISCHGDLLKRIDELKAVKAEQEEIISIQFKDLKSSLNIGTIVKESVAQIANDKDTRKDLMKIVASNGANFIIEKFLGSNNSIKRYLGSILAEKVSNTFIGNLIAKI